MFFLKKGSCDHIQLLPVLFTDLVSAVQHLRPLPRFCVSFPGWKQEGHTGGHHDVPQAVGVVVVGVGLGKDVD